MTGSATGSEWHDEHDVVIVGSGAAALSAALTASVEGARVLVLEKSERLGGTTAMSGAGIWIPANHLQRAAGIADSPEEALRYLHATAPAGWAEEESALWQRFAESAPDALQLIDRHTPLELALTDEPDPMAEYPGGKLRGRMLSPRALRRGVAGALGRHIRRSTLPHLFTYGEVQSHAAYAHPLRAGLSLLPKLAWRLLSGARGQGNALVAGLLKGCLDHGCSIRAGARVVGLVTDATGAVTGVEVERAGARERVGAGRGVLLATGGFEWDPERLAQHFPGPLDRIGSPRTNTGDGHRLAEQAGAALARMDQANVYATLPTRYEGQIHGMPLPFHAARHAIVVNRDAERFASEFDYNFGEAIDTRERDGEPTHLPCWMIADARFFNRSLTFRWYARKLPGWARRADTLAEAAAIAGLPADRLERTVARYNGFARSGRDEDFQRGESAWERYKSGTVEGDATAALGTVEHPPFRVIPVNRSILVTKGGPRTDRDGRVLRPDGSAIAGLYCAGVAMANPIGTRNVGAGTTLGPCLTWGHVCARTMLQANR